MYASGGAAASRRSGTGPMTCGITSPARFTCTTSPMRRSLSAISAKLCNVALPTVTPPISTGSSTAYGLIDPRAPDVHGDRAQRRFGDVRRELPRDRPPRLPPHVAQLGLQCERIDLDHPAVDREIEPGARGVLHLVRPRVHVRQRRAPPTVRRDRDPPRGERLQQLPLGGEGKRAPGRVGVARHRDRIPEETERPPGRDLRIELPQRPGRGVPRIRKHRLPRRDARRVELLKQGKGGSTPRRGSPPAAGAPSRAAGAARRARCAGWA